MINIINRIISKNVFICKYDKKQNLISSERVPLPVFITSNIAIEKDSKIIETGYEKFPFVEILNPDGSGASLTFEDFPGHSIENISINPGIESDILSITFQFEG